MTLTPRLIALSNNYNGSTGSGGLFTGTYSQPAGRCIVVMATALRTLNPPTDTAGNTWIPLFAVKALAINTFFAGAWYAKNCRGSATNQIQCLIGGQLFGAASFWDVDGADLSAPLDSFNFFEKTTNTATITCASYPTTAANTAILNYLGITQFNLTLPVNVTAPDTLDATGVPTCISAASHRLVTTPQSSVAPTFSWTGNVPAWVNSVAVKAPSGQSRALLGVGQ
jgi:hypothetical protein